MNLKRLVSLVLVFLFMGVIAQAQTFYVNNQSGNDANPGTQAQPKLTVGSAIIGAPPGSTISVAFTGDNYTEGNITINKALTFTSTGGGTPVFVNAGIDVQVNTAFTGPFRFTNLTLTAGAVTGASNLTFSGNVTRTAGTVDSQINFTAGTHNFTYNGGAAITSGFELPAAGNTTNFGNLTTVGGGTVLTLNESKTMLGVLTTAAALNLGSNTLTIVGASGAHAVAGNVTNGTLAFSLTGAATITGAVTLPNVTANKTTAGVAAVNLTNITAVSSLVTMGNASANVTHAVTIGTLGSAANNLVNSGNGIINITTAAPVVVHGNVLLNATGLDAANEGQILFAQGGALTVNGNVTNQAGVSIGNNAALNGGNAGLVQFADQVTIINGNVVNSAVLSGTLGVATDATLNANITFLNTAANLTVTGQISNTASTSSAFAGLPVNYNTSANINIAALTTGILRADGGINNQADFAGVTNAANINNGNINIGGGARTGASTIGDAGLVNRIGAITLNSISNVSGNNGNITIAGDGTTSGFFGTSVTVSGGTGGLLTFANENFNLSGSITNSKTTAGAAAVSVGVGAGLAGATFTLGGSILNQAASNVVVPLSVGGAVAITGSINNSGAGTVNFSNLTTANVTVTGGLTSSGAGGTITFPAITNGVVNVNNINLSAGTINFAASHNAAFNVNGPWTVSGGTLNIQGTGAVAVNVSQTVTSTITWTGGTINFTGRNNINIGSVNTYIGGTGVNPTFTSAGTTLRFIEPLPNVVQNIYVGLSSPVYPGPLTIDNDGNIPSPVVRVLPNGGALANLYVLNDVLFDTDVVLNSILLDGVRLNVGKNGLGGGDGDFDNTSGYTTANGGMVMMSGTAALQTVNGNFNPTAGATFGDFGVDNERDAGAPDGVADVVFAANLNAAVFTGDFFLAEGEVDLANTLFNGSAPDWPTVFRTEGLFVTTAPIIAPGTRISVTYYGFDKVTALEIPAGATALHNLTVSTTNGALAGFGIVTMGGPATVNGTLTIDANQSLYTGANVLTLAGATAVVNGNLVDDGGVRVQLAAPTGTVFSGTGILPSIQVNAGSVGNNLAGAGLVSNGFGADGVWGGAGVNADDFNTKDGNITYAGGAASSLMATFSAPVAPSTTNFLNLTTAAGATFTLGANAIMGGNMAHVAGNIDLGGFTLDHRGTAPGINVGATTVNGLLYFQTAATNLTVTGPGTAVIGANFQYADVTNDGATQTFTLLSASTGNLQITGDITLSDNTAAVPAGDGALLDIGAGRTLTAAGANVTVGAGCGFTATNLGTTGILDLDVAAPNTLLTWNTPANSSVTNLTVNDDVALSGGIAGSTLIIGNGAPGAFVHNAGNLDIGTANLQIGDGTAPNPTNFNRTGATATYSGSGYMVWNSTGAFNHSTVVAAGAMTINKFRTLLNLALVNPRGLVVVQNLDILNSSVFTNSVAGVGYLTVGDATNVPVISLGEINATDPNIATNAPTFGNAEVDYIFTDAAGVPADGYTVTTTVWPTAQPARNVTVNMAANVNNVTLAANRNITTALNLTQGGLVWDSPVNVTLDADLVITRNAGGFMTRNADGVAPVGTLTAPSVDLVYTNAVGNTGEEYSLPTVVRNVTLGLPAGTAVAVASSRTIEGVITWNSTLTFNAATTTNVTMAQTLPALSTVVNNGTVNWNGGITVNGTYTNNGTTSTTGGFAGTGNVANNNIMNLDGLNMTAGTFTLAGGSATTFTGDAVFNNVVLPAAFPAATINTANDLAFNGTFTNALLNLNFTGTNDQAVALGANRVVNNISLVKGNDGTVSVSGGNVTLQNGVAPFGLLTLTRGILEMVDPSMLTLNLTVAGGIITNLGYVRNLAQATHYSHVVGKLGVAIPAGTIGRTEWPVGSINPNYRPAAITFTAGNATIAPTTIIVSHVDAEPTGVKNLPLDGGVKFADPNVDNMIGGKAPYHWSFEATTSLGAAQMMNVELNGTNLSRPLDNHNDLRIIRRFDGDVAVNGWFLEGDPANYSNAMYVNTPAPGDTLLLVRNIGSAGSAIAQRALFTIGIPTQPPVFTAKGSDDPLANRTINENDTYTFTYQANDLDANPQAIVYSVQGVAPAVPDTEYSIDSVTGDFEFTPSFDLVLAGDEDFTFIVQAMKDGDSTFVTDQLVINVTHVNRPPSIDSLLADTTSVQILNEFAHEFVSSDPDAGQTLTWALTVDPTGGAATINPATGMFSWTPDTADAGNDYTFTVTVTDDDAAPLADATTFTLSVGYDRVKGDINGDGNVDLLDALLALDAAIEKIVLSGLEHWAGDMDDDGDVTLLDALAILDVWTGGPMAASGGKPTSNILSKIQSYNALASFGKLDVDQESRVIHLPVNLSNVEGIRAFGFDVELSMEVESITPLFNMPSEWLTASNYKDGKLMIGAIGLEDLASDLVLTLEIVLKDKKDKVSLSGIAKINGKEQVLNQVTVQEIPNRFDLSQNYPNPFNPSTIIKYDLAENVNVTMKIYNIAGQEVATIVNGFQEAGSYQVRWDGTNNFGSKVAAGLYIYRLEAGPFTSVKKMMLIK